jgi:pimeloyl-ACP methyl ester carboxylesterase
MTIDQVKPDVASIAHTVRGGGGVQLHVREWGQPDGPAILLIHGWSQCLHCWRRQVEGGLIQSCRVVAMDIRGHGMSERPPGAASYQDPQLWAADVAAVIDQLALHRPVLVAWSYGGFIACDYLRVHGEDSIAALNLVGAAVLRNENLDHIGPGLLSTAPGACDPDLAVNIASIRRFLRACTATPMDDDDREDALCWNMVVPPEVRGALLARRVDSADVLSRLTVPVLVTHGRRDEIVLPSMAAHVLGVCPTAVASWYEGVGHAPFLEDPVRFDRELLALAGRT